MRKVGAIILAIYLCVSCSGPVSVPKRNDFIGRWVPPEGGVIALNEDSTCYINLPSKAYIIRLCEIKEDSIKFYGRWTFCPSDQYSPGPYEINITSDSIIYTSKHGLASKVGFTLYTIGEKGFLDDKPPWYLFTLYLDDKLYKIKKERGK